MPLHPRLPSPSTPITIAIFISRLDPSVAAPAPPKQAFLVPRTPMDLDAAHLAIMDVKITPRVS